MAPVKYCIIVFRPVNPTSVCPWIPLGSMCPETERPILEKVVNGLRDKKDPSNMKVATIIVEE